MKTATRNRLIIGAVVLAAGGLLAREMFFSLTPPRHADHDHAMSTLNSGGFLWVDRLEGGRRNLVGRPDRVLVLHWFDPLAADTAEQAEASRYATTVADDPSVEVLLIARSGSSDELARWAERLGIPGNILYLDPEGRTAELIGVRRYPETLIYNPDGILAFQTRGPAHWTGEKFRTMIEKARSGAGDVH